MKKEQAAAKASTKPGSETCRSGRILQLCCDHGSRQRSLVDRSPQSSERIGQRRGRRRDWKRSRFQALRPASAHCKQPPAPACEDAPSAKRCEHAHAQPRFARQRKRDGNRSARRLALRLAPARRRERRKKKGLVSICSQSALSFGGSAVCLSSRLTVRQRQWKCGKKNRRCPLKLQFTLLPDYACRLTVTTQRCCRGNGFGVRTRD